MQKREADMNHEEYRDYFFKSRYYNSISRWVKIMTSMKVVQWRFKKHPLGSWDNPRRLNPYHPISYLCLFFMWIAIICYSLYEGVGAAIQDGNPFRWR